MSLKDKASIIWPQGAPSKAGFVAAWNPQTQALVNFPVTRATTKTRVNEAGLIESVAANVLPRDFTFGGCGDFMIEPQRTNLIKDSDTSGFATSNLVKSNPSTNDNQGVAQTQFAVTTNGVNQAFGDITIACVAETKYAWWAVFESAGTNDVSFALVNDTSPTSVIRYQTDDNSTTGQTGNFSEVALENLGNGSYKLSGILTTAVGQTTIAPRIRVLTLGGGSSITANGQIMKVSQFQIEQGSFMTSLIPTSGSTVTRNADVPALTGASVLLGDSEGALFVEAAVFETSTSKRISLSDGSTTNRILLGLAANSSLLVSNAAGTQADIGGSPLTSNVFFKVLIRYANNNFAIHQGGVEIGTDTSGTTFTEGLLNTIRFASGTGSFAQFYGRIRQLVVFNQSPTSAQANSITTP